MLVEDCGSDTAVVSSLARIQTGGMWFVPERREGNSCAISLGLFMSVSLLGVTFSAATKIAPGCCGTPGGWGGTSTLRVDRVPILP